MGAERQPDSISGQEGKSGYFRSLAFQFLDEMRLLFRGGQLKKKEGWRNVVEHCVVQLGAAEILADCLELSATEKQKLCAVAAVHDWKKRIDVTRRNIQSVTDPEKQATVELMEQNAQPFAECVNADVDLMRATGPEFLHRALVENKASLLEKLQFYLDDICGQRDGHADIFPLRERIAEVAARRQDLNDDASLTAQLGGRYWYRELELGTAVEREIWEILRQRGYAITSPEMIPQFLRAKLMQRMDRNRML